MLLLVYYLLSPQMARDYHTSWVLAQKNPTQALCVHWFPQRCREAQYPRDSSASVSMFNLPIFWILSLVPSEFLLMLPNHTDNAEGADQSRFPRVPFFPPALPGDMRVPWPSFFPR